MTIEYFRKFFDTDLAVLEYLDNTDNNIMKDDIISITYNSRCDKYVLFYVH